MRILIIRHGEPDYEIDSLTPKGRKEAQLLVSRLTKENIKEIYSSPLGRARMTAEPTAEALGLEIITADWLRELGHLLPDGKCAWHLEPCEWTQAAGLDKKWFLNDFWKDTEIVRSANYAKKGIETFMREHGFKREGAYFTCETVPNDDTYAFFCHQGAGSFLLSYFLNIPLPQALHQLFLAPSSVTEILLETTDNKFAMGRAVQIGDTGHLFAGGLDPSPWGLNIHP